MNCHCGCNNATTPTSFSNIDISGSSIVASTFTGGVIAASEIVGLTVDSVSELENLSLSALSVELVNVLGYYSAGDGGGGSFRYSSTDVSVVNGGTIFSPTAGPGRWLRVFSGSVNVRWFGAVGDGVLDDTASFSAALSYCRSQVLSLFIPSGNYVVSSVDIGAVPRIYGESSLYVPASIITHSSAAADDLFVFSASILRPSIEHLWLVGQKEVNLRNSRTITSVASRTQFDVDSAPPASITNGLCFLYSANDGGAYRYLGTGTIQSVVGNTVSLYAGQDKYATTATNLPLVGYKVCFPEEVTEDTSTQVDPTKAGYCAINITGIGSYILLSQVRIQGFHCAIRRGLSVALQTNEVFISKVTLAGVYCPMAGGSDDNITNIYVGGGYVPQDGIPPETITVVNNLQYRRAAYGLYLSGTGITGNFFQLYQSRVNLVCNSCQGSVFDNIFANQSTFESITIVNNSTIAFGKVVARGIGQTNDTYPVFQVDGGPKVDVASLNVEELDGITAKYAVSSVAPLNVLVRILHITNVGGTGFTDFTDTPGNCFVSDPRSDDCLIDEVRSGANTNLTLEGGGNTNARAKLLLTDVQALFKNGTGALCQTTTDWDPGVAGSYMFLALGADAGNTTGVLGAQSSGGAAWADLTIGGNTASLIVAYKLRLSTVSEYADNAAALGAGKVAGDVYRTGDILKIVH
jgi:hypothetical protein